MITSQCTRVHTLQLANHKHTALTQRTSVLMHAVYMQPICQCPVNIYRCMDPPAIKMQ